MAVGGAQRDPVVGQEITADKQFHRPGRECQREKVESAVEIERGGDLSVGHPEDAVGAIVGQSGAGSRFEDELRRKHNSRQAKLLPAAIEQHRNDISGAQMIGFGEGLAHQDLAFAALGQPAARAQEQPIELRRLEIRQ